MVSIQPEPQPSGTIRSPSVGGDLVVVSPPILHRVEVADTAFIMGYLRETRAVRDTRA
jgi:hypothetical protein